MIRWPHLGLYGSFSNCEAGLVEAISKNFFILDVLTQGRILGIVENLPDNPLEGDAYIIETYSYGAENSIMVWDGDEWKEIIPEAGFLMFNDQLGQFFWFNGTSWIAWPIYPGDVNGPNSSLPNSIARFDGASGKFITDSGVLIDDNDSIIGIGIYSELSVSEETKTEFLYGLFTEDSTSAGSNQTVSLPSMVVKYTGALVSISDIGAPSEAEYSRIHILMNESGSDLTIRNNSSIRTGTGNDLKVKSGAAVWISYDPDSSQWVVVGGSGGGSGGGGDNLNLMPDGSFEADDLTQVTAIGGTVLSIEETEVLKSPFNAKSLKVDAGVLEGVESLFTVESRWVGKYGIFRALVKGTNNTSLYFYVDDGTTEHAYTINTSTLGWQWVEIPFQITGTDISWKVEVGGADVFYLDEIKFGLASLDDIPNITTVTASTYQIFLQHKIVLVDTTSNNVTVYLPPDTSVPIGTKVTVKRISDGANNCTVSTNSYGNIEGEGSKQLPYQWDSYTFIKINSTTWGVF